MSMKLQRGVALFTTLILLVVVTLVSVFLIRNTTFETKISGVYSEKAVAEEAVNGSIEQLIEDATINTATSVFVDDEDSYPKSDVTTPNFPDVDNTIDFVVETPGPCARSVRASSTNIDLSCRVLTVDSTTTYSRSGAGQHDVATGVVHSLIN